MEMYNASDYLRVNRIYKVRAVEATTMYVNPDKKEERRKEERKYSSSPPKKEKKFADEAIEYVDVHRQEIEAVRTKKAAGAEEENLPFMLWVHMTAKRGPIRLNQEEERDRDKKMGRFIEVQEKSAAELPQQKKEVLSFNARA